MKNDSTNKSQEQLTNALRLIEKCEGRLHELKGEDLTEFLAIPASTRIEAYKFLEEVRQTVMQDMGFADEEVNYTSRIL